VPGGQPDTILFLVITEVCSAPLAGGGPSVGIGICAAGGGTVVSAIVALNLNADVAKVRCLSGRFAILHARRWHCLHIIVLSLLACLSPACSFLLNGEFCVLRQRAVAASKLNRHPEFNGSDFNGATSLFRSRLARLAPLCR
jgi:hypothetical protein